VKPTTGKGENWSNTSRTPHDRGLQKTHHILKTPQNFKTSPQAFKILVFPLKSHDKLRNFHEFFTLLPLLATTFRNHSTISSVVSLYLLLRMNFDAYLMSSDTTDQSLNQSSPAISTHR
jgi:hypothetical protein